jgi:hypothetical protein
MFIKKSIVKNECNYSFNGLGNQCPVCFFICKEKGFIHLFYSVLVDHNGLELESVFCVDCKESLLKEYFMLYFEYYLPIK